ncbi:hypothetical protein CLU79DRAFT_692379, partial [Phycomyces nitens]
KYPRTLKKQGYTVVGYARKLTSDEDTATRTRLLNAMSKRLKERSLVDRIFASYASQSNAQLSKRDLKTAMEQYKDLQAEGNTQGKQITSTDKVCLVALDYAGLSTNINDLYEFVKQHNNLEIIIIDNITAENNISVYKRDQLSSEPDASKKL